MPDPSIHSGLKLEEVLPAQIPAGEGITTSTALVQRKRLRLIPQTAGSGVAAGSQINFLIQDPGFLDLRSAVLHANIKVTGATGRGATGKVCLDDGPSWLKQCVIMVDGQNVETNAYANTTAVAETYMTANPSMYNRALSLAGFWKFSPDNAAGSSGAGGSVYQFQDVSANAIAADEFYNSSNGWDIALPLGVVSHFFRQERYFPSRFANNLLIQLQLEQAVTALFATGGASATGFQLDNIYLNIDTVTLNPAFTAFLQDEVMKPGGAGITLPVLTKIASAGTTCNPGADNSFVSSRASKNLSRVSVMLKPNAALNGASLTYPEISTFPDGGFNNGGQVQLYIAGNYYPLFPSQGSDAYWVSHQAYNGTPLSDSDGGIVNYRTWRTTTAAAGTPTTNSTRYSDMWVWGYSLDKMVGTSSPLMHDGVDSTGNAQIQVNLKLGTLTGPTEAAGYQPLVELLGRKFINISNGELTVMG